MNSNLQASMEVGRQERITMLVTGPVDWSKEIHLTRLVHRNHDRVANIYWSCYNSQVCA
jgi:hypothetical protein